VQLNDGKTITSQESSLTTTIEGIECEIEIHLLRNSHISGYPITGRVTISPLNTTSLPTTWAVKDEILLVHGSKTFRRELVQDDPESSHWQFVIDNNPELETGTNVSVILELSVTYLTFAPSEENSKTYTLVFNNVPVFTCR